MTTKLACGHEVLDHDQVHYCSYVGLQQLPHPHWQYENDVIRHPDEHFFLTVHRSSELWFQQIIVDLHRAIDAVDHDNLGLAIWLMQRLTHIAHVLVATMQTLDRLAPTDFLAFRAALGPASGNESQQFREIELLAGLRDAGYRHHLQRATLWTEHLEALWQARSLWDAVNDVGTRRTITLANVYTVAPLPSSHHDVWLLLESMLDFDEELSLWRAAHARVAERVIGPDRKGTGGSAGIRYLDAAARRHVFPHLWELRTSLGHHSTTTG